ncbi:MAG: glycosyltransferase [Williamsia sp.]|nr:glycosyltransferase [Williamsia sp.]
MKTVVILGPAYPLRGGIATFNERLAQELQAQGYNTVIYSFSLQYPAFLFPGKSQYSSEPAPPGLVIKTCINSINPLNWIRVGRELKQMAPDLILVRYWLPLMGPALGTIMKLAKRNRHTKIIAITDNIIPHEKRPGDVQFTRYFLRQSDAFITMSKIVQDALRRFEPVKPAIQTYHPLYDNFGDPVSQEEARARLQINPRTRLVLFFGFIRKYKGLDILLKAWKEVLQSGELADAKLLIAGEFYEDEKKYSQLISELSIQDSLILQTNFIPQSEVKYYFCAADVVVQPYRSATQSGVTPLAYHFDKPMIVTNVGSLADYVLHEKTGLVTPPDPFPLADAIRRYFKLGEGHFLPGIREAKKGYSWQHFVDLIGRLFKNLLVA